jgi:hypothetical protein
MLWGPDGELGVVWVDCVLTRDMWPWRVSRWPLTSSRAFGNSDRIPSWMSFWIDGRKACQMGLMRAKSDSDMPWRARQRDVGGVGMTRCRLGGLLIATLGVGRVGGEQVLSQDTETHVLREEWVVGIRLHWKTDSYSLISSEIYTGSVQARN